MEKKVYIAPDAVVTGDVALGDKVNIWHGAVLRGDCGKITLGEGTNIQDLCVLHEETTLGKNCTVGHGAIVHGCTVGDNTLIGMGAVIVSGARIGRDCIVGAGSLVTGRTVVPDGSLVLGNPAKVIRPLTEAEIETNRLSMEQYLEMTEWYHRGGRDWPDGKTED